jgi:hypothetical protein
MAARSFLSFLDRMNRIYRIRALFSSCKSCSSCRYLPLRRPGPESLRAGIWAVRFQYNHGSAPTKRSRGSPLSANSTLCGGVGGQPWRHPKPCSNLTLRRGRSPPNRLADLVARSDGQGDWQRGCAGFVSEKVGGPQRPTCLGWPNWDDSRRLKDMLELSGIQPPVRRICRGSITSAMERYA